MWFSLCHVIRLEGETRVGRTRPSITELKIRHLVSSKYIRVLFETVLQGKYIRVLFETVVQGSIVHHKRPLFWMMLWELTLYSHQGLYDMSTSISFTYFLMYV
jgi:hypothetical protein